MINPKREFNKQHRFKRVDYSDEQEFIPLIDSKELFGPAKEVLVRHQGTIYRLRITQNDKLIMNK